MKFRDKFQLNFPLLVDPDHAVAEEFGALREKNMYGKIKMGMARSTFLIGAKGVIRKAWKAVRVDGHDEAVLTAARIRWLKVESFSKACSVKSLPVGVPPSDGSLQRKLDHQTETIAGPG